MNRMLRRLFPPVASVAVWLVLSAAPQAIERKPLPAFTVTTLAGMGMRSEDLTQDGRWLLLYVRPDCEQCDVLLRAIDQAEPPLVVSRLVIVVGGVDQAGLARFVAAYPKLSAAAWYADTPGSVPALVKAAGAPFALGMKDRITQWGLVGVLPDPATAGSTLASWVR